MKCVGWKAEVLVEDMNGEYYTFETTCPYLEQEAAILYFITYMDTLPLKYYKFNFLDKIYEAK